MAGLLEKVLDFVGWETNVDGEEDIYEDDIIDNTPHHRFERGVSHRKNPQGKVLNMNNNNNLKVVVLSPQNILEARELCDHLKSNKPVIMNVEGVDTPLAQRMVDFLSGAVYCLDGDIQKISSGIFLATPASIEITGDLKDEMRNKGVFSWVK
ncbi:MAG: cell division protein SepF [Clostridiaceae bacterium]|jgi:cell division inhibitor SepF|nr:cell division protein SepF [Clostridiaceae bacterium]